MLVAENQRVGVNGLLVRSFGGAHHGLERVLLAAPDHRTGLERHGIGRQVGDHEARVEGAHLPGLVFAHQETQTVAAGRQREPGVVVETAVGQGLLAGGIQVYLDVIAHVAHLRLALVEDVADEIDLGLAAALPILQSDQRSRHLHRNGHEVSGRGNAEVIDFERQRYLRDRVGGGERFL